MRWSLYHADKATKDYFSEKPSLVQLTLEKNGKILETDFIVKNR